MSNNHEVNLLENVYQCHQGLPKVSVRHAAKYVSQTGGQGIQRCKCKGDCSTNRCKCKKNEVKCGNKCKCNASCCKNRED